MKRLMFMLCLALLVAPAAAIAADPPSPADVQAAGRVCAAQRTALGATLFASTYGGAANAFGKCVSKWAHTVQHNTIAASATCKAQQADANFAAAHDGKTFVQFYGSGQSGRNALGNCISATSKARTAAQSSATVNAARACGAERKADLAAFKTKYGATANAFGKCVSAKAKAQQGS